ncbi:MAG: RagB/SusD family nutrient uptake outer membrane protein, partial [Odoribacteraceae bacterium]|nr:RagB/SusD family nutrient uptake outer membrane protein [Odoribacteraceae bacterium]
MKKIYYMLAFLFPLASCNDWLDVVPLGEVDEDKMFEDERGFHETLAGSYSLLTSPATYGMELTAGFPDEIVRYWDERSEFFNFKYDDANVVGRLSSTWSKMYETIANLNLLLGHAGKWTPETLPHYNLIVGEAKGLRAYLHLDLLRIFGPVLPDG